MAILDSRLAMLQAAIQVAIAMMLLMCIAPGAEARGGRPIFRSVDVPLPPPRPDEFKPQMVAKPQGKSALSIFEIPLPPPRPTDFSSTPHPDVAQSAEAPPPESAEAPLPPSRPTDVPASSAETPQTAPEPTPPPIAAPDETCPRVLASDKLVVKSAEPVTGPDGCGIASPVHLEAIVLPNGTHVPMEPKSLIRCDLAEALADWIRDDIAPLAAKTGSPVKKIIGSDGYECRSRNHVAGAKLSEHGIGNAFDMPGVELENGTRLMITPESQPREFMEGLKASACARFHTVLGPGSDAYHETHLHVDLAQRRNDYRICQWEMK